MNNEFNYPIQPGVTIVVNDVVCLRKELIQYRFPRTKKKRTHNKWKKRPGNYKTIEHHSIIKIEPDIILVSQKTFDSIKNTYGINNEKKESRN